MVDVVVRLHGPTDQAPKLRHLRVLAHVQLDDDPRTPIQQSVGEEFRQHDGVVMILMHYRRRASPKHRYNIYRGLWWKGAPHTAKNMITWINLCLGVPPAPVYKGSRGGGRPALYGAPRRSPPPSRSRTPTRRGKEVGRERERGRRPPPSPSPIRTRGGGGARPLLAAPLSLH